MLVRTVQLFISDLHLTDGTIGEAVSPETLLQLVSEIKPPAAGHIHLVLLGDVFELLRSSAWSKLWDHGGYHVAPWTAMNAGFKGFPPKAATCALRILRGIIARYSAFRDALKERKPWLRVHYIPGNHDYMVQLIPDARREIVDFLSLDNVPVDRPFPTAYTDDEVAVYATHGNSSDPLNWHREAEGKWAFGDVIVLRLVNPFIKKACDHLGQPLSGGPEIAVAIQDLDNVEPNEDLAVYFRFLLEKHFANANQRRQILTIWQDSVNELLDLADFQDALYKDRHHELIRTALSLSRNLNLTELALKVREKYQALFGADDVDLQHAQRIYDLNQRQYRFIVFGHTHKPRLEPLAHSVYQPAYYVNTGCWRRLTTRRKDLAEFRPARVGTRFVVDSAGGQPRYRLLREIEIA